MEEEAVVPEIPTGFWPVVPPECVEGIVEGLDLPLDAVPVEGSGLPWKRIGME